MGDGEGGLGVKKKKKTPLTAHEGFFGQKKKKKKNPICLSVEVLKPEGQDLEFQDLDSGPGRTDSWINKVDSNQPGCHSY